MRTWLTLLLLVVTVGAARADGVISMNWSSCTGPVNLDVAGGGPVDAYVSVLGQSQTAQSYQVWVYGRTTTTSVPDAWRFDASGCETPALFTLNHLAPAAVAKTCPSFQGNLQSLQIKDYSYDATVGNVRIVLANAYPNGGLGNPAATNPAQRYFLANFHFDLTFAVAGPSDPAAGTCGGVGSRMCWLMTTTSWLDTNGNEFPWTHGGDYLTNNDPSNGQHCNGDGFVPARARTWGSIKNQYR